MYQFGGAKPTFDGHAVRTHHTLMQQFFETLKEFQFLATGLFAVLAAAIGFAGVWYAQNRIARTALEERDHREKVAREEREHREAMARRQMEEEKTDRRTSFIHAISGELSALFPMVNNAHQRLRRLLLCTIN